MEVQGRGSVEVEVRLEVRVGLGLHLVGGRAREGRGGDGCLGECEEESVRMRRGWG